MESVFALVAPEQQEEALRRAQLRVQRDIVDSGYQVEIRRRDGGRVLLELAGVPLGIPGTPPRQQLVVVVRDVTARRLSLLHAAVRVVTPRPGGAEVIVATGGHPLPLVLRADGTVETAGRPGTLLGIVASPEISEERVRLEAGDALVLYTDGVVEASPTDGALAPERLAELLVGLRGRDAERIAEANERRALEVQGGRLRDDVAVVALRLSAPGAG